MRKEDIIKKVTEILNEYLEKMDLDIYKIEYKKEGPDWKLRVILDKPETSENEYVSIEECEDVTRYLNKKLDEEDFMSKSYFLEVSSPGLDRELIKDSDFRRFAGHKVDIKLYEPINGNKILEGNLIGKEDGVINIDVDGDRLSIDENKVAKISLAVVF